MPGPANGRCSTRLGAKRQLDASWSVQLNFYAVSPCGARSIPMVESAAVLHTPRTELAETFARNGFVVPDLRLPDGVLREMQRSVEKLIAENPAVRPEHLVLRWGGRDRALPTHQAFLEYVKTPEILDLVEQLLGPDIVCWGAHVFCKPAGTGLAIPWHQDGQYWPIRPLASCTVWIALDDSTLENGCLRIVRGSHRMRTIYHHRPRWGRLTD